MRSPVRIRPSRLERGPPQGGPRFALGMQRRQHTPNLLGCPAAPEARLVSSPTQTRPRLEGVGLRPTLLARSPVRIRPSRLERGPPQGGPRFALGMQRRQHTRNLLGCPAAPEARLVSSPTQTRPRFEGVGLRPTLLARSPVRIRPSRLVNNPPIEAGCSRVTPQGAEVASPFRGRQSDQVRARFPPSRGRWPSAARSEGASCLQL